MSENTILENVTATLEKTKFYTPDLPEKAKLYAPNINEAAASAAEGRRLYIGNLAYSTTQEQLKDFFIGFSVESVSIPTNPRLHRAAGYAFVDLHTKDEADRAIAELSGKEILERKVSVQTARKLTGERRLRRFYKRKSRRPAKNRAPQNGVPEAVAPVNVPGQVLSLTGNIVHKEPPAKQDNPPIEVQAQGGYRPRRRRGPPEDGVPSKTKVMVANLPYELSEDKLKELFTPYQPEAAKIALRPIRPYMVRILAQRGEPRKGRGFGFVTLSSEEMQQKAIMEMNGKIVEGREIAVKIAIDNPKLEAEAEAKFMPKEDAVANEVVVNTEETKIATNGVKAEAAPATTTTA